MPTPKQVISSALDLVQASPHIPNDEKQKIAETLKSATSPLEWDPWIYRLVVSFLGAAALATVVGCLILAGFEADVPQGVVALGSAAVGALAGLLAPSPSGANHK